MYNLDYSVKRQNKENSLDMEGVQEMAKLPFGLSVTVAPAFQQHPYGAFS